MVACGLLTTPVLLLLLPLHAPSPLQVRRKDMSSTVSGRANVSLELTEPCSSSWHRLRGPAGAAAGLGA